MADYRNRTGIGRAQELVEVTGTELNLTQSDGEFIVDVTNNDTFTSYEVDVRVTVVGPVGTSLSIAETDNFIIGTDRTRERRYTFNHNLNPGAEVTACANAEIVGSGGGGL